MNKMESQLETSFP